MDMPSVNTALRRARVKPAVTRPVWDGFVRLFHWSLVAAVTIALVTALALPPAALDLHIASGVLAAALVGARIVWGFWGGTYARFAGFLPAPRAVLAHLRRLRAGAAHRHLGHNPLGALMVLALLGTILLTALTGLVALGGAYKTGPLAFATTFALGDRLRALHELLAFVLIALVAAHVAGVIFESRRSKENLADAMLRGRKAARPGDIAPAARPARPGLALALGASLAAWGTLAAFTLSDRPGLGAPTQPLRADYAKACGECHIAYHPSLMPAAAWTVMTEDLARHFGENAKLDADLTPAIRAYLTANAAEAFDTLPANALRRTDPAEPLRITAAPFWKATHADIPAGVFKTKAVGGAGNCEACHRDAATGAFYPGAIHIPNGGKP